VLVSPVRDPLYRGYCFPAEIISYAVWLYYRFPLSHRDIEDLLAERGVQVSYPPVLKRVLPGVEHRRHKGLNNRAASSHRPVRKRERVLQRFKSPVHAQCFLERFSAVCNHCTPSRPHPLRQLVNAAAGPNGTRFAFTLVWTQREWPNRPMIASDPTQPS